MYKIATLFGMGKQDRVKLQFPDEIAMKVSGKQIKDSFARRYAKEKK